MRSEPQRRNLALVGVGVLWLAHALGLLALIQPTAAAFDARPLLDQDWSLHYHNLQSLLGFWHGYGRLWGYDPYFMAGYPSNTIGDVSIKFYELATLATPLLAPVQAFKLWVLGATSLMPWLFFASYLCFFGAEKRLGGLVAAALGTAAWWNSLSREMLFYGMVGFPAASVLALLVLALFGHVITGRRGFWRPFLALAAGSALLLPLHLQAALVLTLPGALSLALARRWRGALRAAGAIGLALLANAVWLWPFLSHLGDQASGAIVDALPLFTSADAWTFFRDYLTPAHYWSFRLSPWEKVLRSVLLVLGVAGLARLANRRRWPVALPLAAFAAGLFALAYFGSLSESLSGWQPLRFRVPLDATLALCAAYAVAASPPGRTWWRPVAWALALIGLAGFGVNLVQTEGSGIMRLRAETEVPVETIAGWLHDPQGHRGRVLFEESGDESGFVYDGLYLSSFLPHLTGRQFIGGPINLYADRHHFAEFHSALLFKRDIASIDDVRLRAYLRLYNVTEIVVFHPKSIQRFAALGEPVRWAASLGGLQLFKVDQPSNWFWTGSGQVRAGLNRIEATDVQGADVVLKYHWIEGLSASPAVEIEPVQLLDDPIPFIRVRNAPERFVLAVGGAR